LTHHQTVEIVISDVFNELIKGVAEEASNIEIPDDGNISIYDDFHSDEFRRDASLQQYVNKRKGKRKKKNRKRWKC
jgi:hypothetical protein